MATGVAVGIRAEEAHADVPRRGGRAAARRCRGRMRPICGQPVRLREGMGGRVRARRGPCAGVGAGGRVRVCAVAGGAGQLAQRAVPMVRARVRAPGVGAVAGRTVGGGSSRHSCVSCIGTAARTSRVLRPQQRAARRRRAGRRVGQRRRVAVRAADARVRRRGSLPRGHGVARVGVQAPRRPQPQLAAVRGRPAGVGVQNGRDLNAQIPLPQI